MSRDPKYYSIPKAAEMCGVSRTAMWNWVKSGEVDALVTPGGHHRIHREEIEKLLERHQQHRKPDVGPKTILIVDDDPSLLKLLRQRFTKAGYRVEVAVSGFEAGVNMSQINPDLVLLDLFMPGMDGFEVCRMIKANEALRGTQVVVMTGHHTPENEARVMALGADACLSKSISPKALVDQVSRMLDAARGAP